MDLLCPARSSSALPSLRCTADLTYDSFAQTMDERTLNAHRTRSGLIDAQDCLAQHCFVTAALSSVSKDCTPVAQDSTVSKAHAIRASLAIEFPKIIRKQLLINM